MISRAIALTTIIYRDYKAGGGIRMKKAHQAAALVIIVGAILMALMPMLSVQAESGVNWNWPFS